MAAPATRTLYESATLRARVVRHIDIVCLIVDGGGSMIVPMADFMQNRKWASGRIASGNLMNDRSRFIERLSVLVSRPGSLAATRGNPRQLEAIARSMRAAGYDLGEWSLPAEIRNPAPPADALAARTKRPPLAESEPDAEAEAGAEAQPENDEAAPRAPHP